MSILLGGASIFGLKDGEVINEWPQPDTVQRLAAPNSRSLAIERGGEIWLRTAKNLEKYCDDGAFCVTNQNDTNGQFFTVSDKVSSNYLKLIFVFKIRIILGASLKSYLLLKFTSVF